MAVQIGWSYKDIPDFYNRVRTVLDGLSVVSLPDKYIDMQEKAPYSELYAKRRVPGWAALGEEDFALFESAIVYKTASMFESLASSNVVKEKALPTITLKYFARNAVQVNGLSLSELADLLLGELSGDDGLDFIGFMVTQ